MRALVACRCCHTRTAETGRGIPFMLLPVRFVDVLRRATAAYCITIITLCLLFTTTTTTLINYDAIITSVRSFRTTTSRPSPFFRDDGRDFLHGNDNDSPRFPGNYGTIVAKNGITHQTRRRNKIQKKTNGYCYNARTRCACARSVRSPY